MHAGDPSRFLIGSRLSEPLGYPNATGALFMILTWLCVGLASRPWLPAPARGLAFGLAGLNATLNLLTESRGSAYTLPARRHRVPRARPQPAALAGGAGLLGVAVVPVVLAVLHIHDGDPAQFTAAIRHALYVGLLWSVLLVGAGVAVRGARRARERVAARSCAAPGSPSCSRPSSPAAGSRPWSARGTSSSSAWHSFKYSGESVGAASHFGGLGSNRYDFWRVGLIEFKRHPVQGIGVDNFLVPYLAATAQPGGAAVPAQPLHPPALADGHRRHRALRRRFWRCWWPRSSGSRAGRSGISPGSSRSAVPSGSCTAWSTGSGRCPCSAFSAWRSSAPRAAWRRGAACAPALGRSWKLVLAGAGVAAASSPPASFALPWFAQRDIQQATADWRTDPAAAFATLQSAHSLNPLDDQADVLAGAIASRLHRYPLMQARFQAAVKRSPDDWYANLELGIAASLTGQHDAGGLVAAARTATGSGRGDRPVGRAHVRGGAAHRPGRRRP